MRTTTLRDRSTLLQVLSILMRRADDAYSSLDRRTRRNVQRFISAMIWVGSPRLNRVAQALLSVSKAQRVSYIVDQLSYFINESQWEGHLFFNHFRQAALEMLPVQAVARHRGKQIVIFDPTVYPKRSRGPEGMEHIGRVKNPKTGQKGPGYVDICAGLLLKGGRRVFPPGAPIVFQSASDATQSEPDRRTGHLVRFGRRR